MVFQIQDENGSVIETKDPTLLRKTVSAETSTMVKEYMRATMEYGTGTTADVPGYEIGAKTGTAEKLPRGNGNYLLSYIGCAPQENPEVIVYVVVDEPNVADQSTSRYVLELAQKIMSQAFPYLNISTVDGYVPTETMPVPVDEEAQAAAQAAQVAGQSAEYVNYDEAYEETYNNPDGAYIDETYAPDLDDWATGTPTE